MKEFLFRPRLRGISLLVLTLMLLSVATVFAQAPDNDHFGGAVTITNLPFNSSINTSEATTDSDDPVGCFELFEGSTVWYALTPTEDLRIVANTYGSDYDTTIIVGAGSPESFNTITCGFQEMAFEANAGITYFFMVGAYGGDHGSNLVFSVDGLPPTPPFTMQFHVDPNGSVVSKTGEVTLHGTMTCSRSANGFVSGQLEQRAGRALIRQLFSLDSFFHCEGETPWSVTFKGDEGNFVAGKAQLSITGYAEPVDGLSPYVEQSVNTTVNLKGKK